MKLKLQPNDIELRQLEIFCLIVEYKSFSRAAQQLYLTQPTVSEHIANLESAVRLRLLDRKGKKIALTSAGKLFHSYALKILEIKKKLLKEMTDFSSHARGNLVVAASSIPGSYVLPEFVTRFKKLYPDASITLKLKDTGEVIQGLRDGDYELGVVGAKPKAPELVHHVLCEDQLLLVLNPGHPLANRRTAIPQQMVSELAFVMREKGSAQREMVEKTFSKHKIPLTMTCEMSGNEAIKEAVKNGDGAAILSYRAVQNEVRNGLLKKARIKDVTFKRFFYIILHKHRTRAPLTELFLKFIQGKQANPQAPRPL